MLNIKKDAAKKYLAKVPGEKSFWVNKGPIIGSLEELPPAIKKLKKETFLHHVNKNKNDFAKWISEVIGDTGLAKQIGAKKDKTSIIGYISKRLAVLKKAAK